MLLKVTYKLLALSSIPFLITACDSATEVPSTPSETVAVKGFTAKYYFEDDGTDPGVGTDGNDSSIVPVLKHTETVTRPAIDYSYADEFGIDSYNLYTQWEGNITMHSDANISANFDVSWSDVSFYLDDILVSKWSNSNKVIPLTLNEGNYTVRIEYHNHWHTTGFNASFTDYTQTDVSEDISSIVTETTQISYVSAYEVANTTSIYNEVEITLPQGNRSHLLFLGSYRAVNWVINNPYNVELQGIVFNSYAPGTTVTNAGNALLLHASDLAAYGATATDINADIFSMTGKESDYILEEYSIGNFAIPAL